MYEYISLLVPTWDHMLFGIVGQETALWFIWHLTLWRKTEPGWVFAMHC